jgi:hypothetical protein
VESPATAIVPEATESVREAIVAALRVQPDADDGWAAAALREGVDVDADD